MMTNRTKECPGCALENEADTETCVYCGYEFPQQKNSRVLMALLFALLLIVPILWVVLSLL